MIRQEYAPRMTEGRFPNHWCWRGETWLKQMENPDRGRVFHLF
jgi:hypothetical protein